MKKIHRVILENQLAIMEALDYLMLPQRPRKKVDIRKRAMLEIAKREGETGVLLEKDNMKKRTKVRYKERKYEQQ